jgi:predicted transcriptional regulator
MIDTLQIYEDLKDDISPSAAKKIAESIGRVYNELLNTVTKEEFRELKEVVAELAEAQRRTEQRVNELAEAQRRTEQRVNELAEAQRRTEQRVNELAEAQRRTEQRVNELAEAQRRTEQRVNELAEAQRRTEQRVNELAEAQRRTEQRVNELAEAQRRTEQRVNELAEAQRRTEQELKKLVGEHRKTREQLGGLSHSVGYILEDRAYRGLPELLKRDFGIRITSPLKRDYIEISPGEYKEANIIGKGRHNGQEVLILGECKTQLKKTDIDSFIKFVKKAGKILQGEKLLLTVTYQASPPVRRYAEQKGVKLYFSYEMPLL